MKSTRRHEFLEKGLLLLFLQFFVFSCNTSAQNVIIPSIETINIELNEENPIQFIQSPGFPTKPYPKNYSVNYDLNVNLSDRVEGLASRIGIQLELIAIQPSDNCRDSCLTIIFPLGEMRAFCGLHAGKTIISESTEPKIQFKGNALEQDRGYRIGIEVIRSKCSHKYINISEGVINSPNYPNNYTEEETCVWEVEAPEGKFVKLIFDELFDIKASNNICAEHYLLISKSGDFDTNVQRFCGNQRPEELVSHSNKMLIKFNSGCCGSAKGFRIKFLVHDRPEAAPEKLPMLTPEDCPCGKENLKIVKRIVGGIEVRPPHRYPWMVSIVTTRGSPFCGGCLINNYYVLTAAHCLVEESADNIGVRIGQHSLQESTPILRISKIITHKKYDSVSQNNDIGLLRLKDPVQFTEYIQPVCLPASDIDEPDGLWVAGWGRRDYGGRSSDRLREIHLPEYPFPKCEAKYSGLISKSQLCAGGVKGQDACQGDSGAPLTSRIANKVNVVGVVSWGIGCAQEDYPGVYTRITSYLDWIANQTKDATYCSEPLGNSTNNLIDRAIQPNLNDCGIRNKNVQKRVVGGSETTPQEFPWIVVIAYNGQVIGSGSLISDSIVLTSAHILKPINTRVSDIKIIVGAHDITRSEFSKKSYKVNQIIFHPMFGSNSALDYDFALIELKSTPEGFLPAHRPVCLPRSDTPYNAGTPVVGAGWGRTSTYSSGSTVLRKVVLYLLGRRECTETYGRSVTNTMVCAMDDNKDMCLGDIGAPLMQFFEGRMYLFGVYSWQSSEGCATGKPSVFADVRYVLEWVRDVTDNMIRTA